MNPEQPREIAAPECATCAGTRMVPGMVMLNAHHGAGWGVVPCPDCRDLGDLHQCGEIWNGMSYDCICGEPWLTFANICSTQRPGAQ